MEGCSEQAQDHTEWLKTHQDLMYLSQPSYRKMLIVWENGWVQHSCLNISFKQHESRLRTSIRSYWMTKNSPRSAVPIQTLPLQQMLIVREWISAGLAASHLNGSFKRHENRFRTSMGSYWTTENSPRSAVLVSTLLLQQNVDTVGQWIISLVYDLLNSEWHLVRLTIDDKKLDP